MSCLPDERKMIFMIFFEVLCFDIYVTRWTKQAFSCSKFLSPGGQLWANTAFEGSNSIALGYLNFTAGLT